MKKAICTLFVCVLIGSCLAQQASRFDLKKLHWCKIDGIPDSVLCGFCPVIENRQTNKGRNISLYIIVIPALHRDSLLAPIFDIDGGPGAGDTKNAFFYGDPANPFR